MGREIRRVPPNWEHPKEERFDYASGQYIQRFKPLFDESYGKVIKEWIDNHNLWEKGKHPDQRAGSTKRYYAEWAGNPPDINYYRPDCPEETCTWYQVYETVSEGTPVSPPFATAEELIDYLSTYGDFWDQQRGDPPWPRQRAEAFVKEGGWAPSIIFTAENGIQNGTVIYDK